MQTGKQFAAMIGAELLGFFLFMGIGSVVIVLGHIDNVYAGIGIGLGAAGVGMFLGAWAALRKQFGPER